MGTEIERKFLIDTTKFKELISSDETHGLMRIVQGYISEDPAVRLRLIDEGNDERAELTIKGSGLLTRSEFNFDIPYDDALAILATMAKKSLSKNRYTLQLLNHTWEIDQFLGKNEGLWLAEIELSSEDEPFERPAWLGKEVTEDPNFQNINLAK